MKIFEYMGYGIILLVCSYIAIWNIIVCLALGFVTDFSFMLLMESMFDFIVSNFFIFIIINKLKKK